MLTWSSGNSPAPYFTFFFIRCSACAQLALSFILLLMYTIYVVTRFAAICTVWLCGGYLSLAGQAACFNLVTEKDGIRLYERWHTTSDDRAYRELKAVFTANASYAELRRQIREEALTRQWMQRIHSVEHRPGANPQHWYAYVQYEMPWPARNQDFVLTYQERQPQPGYREVTFSSTTLTEYPLRSGVERITSLSGRWEFTLQPDGNHHINYYVMIANPSAMPRMLTDPIVRANLLNTMQAFRQHVEQTN